MRILRLAAAFLVVLLVGSTVVQAESLEARLLPRLSEEQRQVYGLWREARQRFDAEQDAYWSQVAAKRAERRRRMATGQRITAADFVMRQPPKYQGPALRPDIVKIMSALQPPAPPSEITSLPEMLEAARKYYRFAPTLVAEREFKRRYAAEALAVGLSKEQVVRVYALETGGRGTFDMQAGINPETKAGRPISTAMGYAQLLAANSIDELVRYGDGFISRLGAMAVRPGTPNERARELSAKIEAIRAMLRVARSVPSEWSRHVELARSPQGYGIHVLNLDGDVGPWLQVIKLKGIKDTAEQAGRTTLTPAELELMNLAGPRTGLEMMEPAGGAAPTANFFSRAAYYRNTIVREKTGAELLAAIDGRMTENMARNGSIEFAAVFDELMGRPSRIGMDDRRNLMPASARPASAPALAVPPPYAAGVRPQMAPASGGIVSPPPQPSRIAPPKPRPALRPTGFPD